MILVNSESVFRLSQKLHFTHSLLADAVFLVLCSR